MLVLNRKAGERVLLRVPGLAEPVVVTVVDVERRRVRLGFDAPLEVVILREEVTGEEERRWGR